MFQNPFFLMILHSLKTLFKEVIVWNNQRQLRLTFPISPSPPKGLFQNFPNVIESFEPNTNYGVSSKDQNYFNDFNSFSYYVLPPLAPTIKSGTFLHGSPITKKPFWGQSNFEFSGKEITPQNYTNPFSTFNFMDLGYSTRSTTSDQNGQDSRKKTQTMRKEPRL